MIKKRKRGRPPIKYSEKKKLVPAYFNDAEKKLILKRYESLTAAIREKILPELLTA